MSALDHCEDETIRAFEKDGWRIDSKPFFIRTPESQLRADASFERRANGRNEQIIVVEIKCFTDAKRDLDEIYRAIGQYEIYRAALRPQKMEDHLYLTIPQVAYARFSRRAEFMDALHTAQVRYVIIDLDKEEIVRWHP